MRQLRPGNSVLLLLCAGVALAGCTETQAMSDKGANAAGGSIAASLDPDTPFGNVSPSPGGIYNPVAGVMTGD